MDHDDSRIKASLQLFYKLGCCSSDLNAADIYNVDVALALVNKDKLRCHIINCLAALHLVHAGQNEFENSDEEKYESVKMLVFHSAITMILDDEFDSDDAVVGTIYSEFPDENKMSDERSWLSQHFAIALSVKGEISEDEIRIMLSVNPLAKDRLRKKEDNELFLDNENCKCALHLVAQYSQSLELLQDILQIDDRMTQMVFETKDTGEETTPLGILSKRIPFPTFDSMVLCLIEADSSMEVIHDGIINCLKSYEYHKFCLDHNISPGSRGAKSLILLGTLLDANPTVLKYDDSHILHTACVYLEGELCLSVLSLFLKKDSSGVRNLKDGNLPIHWAADRSCLDVVRILHKAWPESISSLDDEGRSLLHGAIIDNICDISDVIAKVQYLCDQCPALIHLKDFDGNTALHDALGNRGRFCFQRVKTLCDIDSTVVRAKFTPPSRDLRSGYLPLHTLICYKYWAISELSDEGDCFRLLLRLYPAAAGIEDDHLDSAYDKAVSKNLSAYFLRLLLSADPTIDPVRMHTLNFEARRQGMFLAFSALTSDVEATIWTKIRLKGRDILQHVVSYL